MVTIKGFSQESLSERSLFHIIETKQTSSIYTQLSKNKDLV